LYIRLVKLQSTWRRIADESVIQISTLQVDCMRYALYCVFWTNYNREPLDVAKEYLIKRNTKVVRVDTGTQKIRRKTIIAYVYILFSQTVGHKIIK